MANKDLVLIYSILLGVRERKDLLDILANVLEEYGYTAGIINVMEGHTEDEIDNMLINAVKDFIESKEEESTNEQPGT